MQQIKTPMQQLKGKMTAVQNTITVAIIRQTEVTLGSLGPRPFPSPPALLEPFPPCAPRFLGSYPALSLGLPKPSLRL